MGISLLSVCTVDRFELVLQPSMSKMWNHLIAFLIRQQQYKWHRSHTDEKTLFQLPPAVWLNWSGRGVNGVKGVNMKIIERQVTPLLDRFAVILHY